MTLRMFLQMNLAELGYDGLYNVEADCACRLRNLCPCDEPDLEQCRPGYLLPCPAECGLHAWHIGARRGGAQARPYGKDD